MRYLAEFVPVSGLVFRDARPFSAGEDTTGANLPFPPPPEAFWSALNRVLVGAGKNEANNRRLIPTRSLRVRGFYLADQRGPLLPAMADLMAVRPADDETAPETLCLLAPRRELAQTAAGAENLRLVWLAVRGSRSWPCENSFLRPDTFLPYLLGDMGLLGPEHLTRPDDLVREQPRTGVALKGRNAREGMLYTEPVVFPAPGRELRFCLEFETRDEVPETLLANRTSHLVRLGGEGKLAQLSIKRVDSTTPLAIPERARQQVLEAASQRRDVPPFRVKLCLLSPAVFSARRDLLVRPTFRTPAWRPFWMDNADQGWCRPIFDDQKYRLRLVAAAAPKAFPLGAWDRAKHEPRPLHRCQPAGTVYYLELEPREGAEAQEALERFFDDFWLGTLLVKTKPKNGPSGSPDRPLPGYNHERVSPHGLRGFGWTVIGVWNYV